ncbi:MAG: O-antigen ligase family protein [Lachnospiraceae bacterium]|nr:O-antigen ligase family protein [Lachnospiraceae bacterium]
MGSKMQVDDAKITGTDKRITVKQIVSALILSLLFLGYALTFLVPKFYGMTDAYVGVFVFVMLLLLLAVNTDPVGRLKKKEKDLILLLLLLLISGINILIVHSGKGAFFVLADFLLILYLSDKLVIGRRQVLWAAGAYFALLFIWLLFVYPKMFAEYGFYGYNTNTAATFTIYTLLCAFLFVQMFMQRFEAAGFFAVLLIVRGVQLSLYHRARGAFIMLGVFLLLYYIVPKAWWLKKAVFRCLYLLATLGSLLFVALYTVAGTLGVNYRLPFFYKEIFSGREEIWMEFFRLFLQKPLTGIGTNVQISSFFEFNVHNAMYNILVVYGLIAFAGTLCLLYGKFEKMREKALSDRTAYCALCILMAVFFESFFDVDLLWVDYALNLLFILLVVNHEQNQVSGQ